MRPLVTAIILMACMGCESAPEAPVTLAARGVTPLEVVLDPIPLFATGDLVTITFPDGTSIDGMVVAVGPMSMWSKTQTVSRVYLVRAKVNGQDGTGKAPEFALTRRVQ